MKLKEILTIAQGTAIQKEALIKNYIGSNIEIDTIITNIESNKIYTWGYIHRYGHIQYENEDVNRIDTDNLVIDITYENEKFVTELLSYSSGDRVMIIAKLSEANFSGYYSHYKFELVSIRKISTLAEMAQAQETQKDAARNKSSGCFIATACYGNYNAPEVLVLQQYRDDRLLRTFLGKAFVKLYYSISPSFATLISKSDLLRKLVRQYFLEPIVTRLQRQNK